MSVCGARFNVPHFDIDQATDPPLVSLSLAQQTPTFAIDLSLRVLELPLLYFILLRLSAVIEGAFKETGLRTRAGLTARYGYAYWAPS